MNPTLDLALETLDVIETPNDTTVGVLAGFAFIGGIAAGAGLVLLLT